jgi:hypothetical protein
LIDARNPAAVLSSFGPKETMARLEAEIKAKGMTVFARIDHAAGAAEVGLPLRPTPCEGSLYASDVSLCAAPYGKCSPLL